MATSKDLANFMGGQSVVGSPNSEFEFIEIIRAGLPNEVIARVAQSSSISEDTLLESLRFAKRSSVSRESGESRLEPAESELIFRFSKVVVVATEILGDRTKARTWLLAENRALRGNRPIDLLDTAIGFDDVLDVLQRIDYGVFS